MAPLTITLELEDVDLDPATLSDDPLVNEVIADGLSVLARRKSNRPWPYFVVRGSCHQTELIRQSILKLQQKFMNKVKKIAVDPFMWILSWLGNSVLPLPTEWDGTPDPVFLYPAQETSFIFSDCSHMHFKY